MEECADTAVRWVSKARGTRDMQRARKARALYQAGLN